MQQQIDKDLKQALLTASPYEDKPTVFPHRAGRGMNPTLGLLFFPSCERSQSAG